VTRCLWTVFLLLAACGGGGGGGGPGEDTPAPPADTLDLGPADAGGEDATITGDTWYTLTVDLEMGPGVACDAALQVTCLGDATCCRYTLERDLTGLAGRFAFGSTHIAPAVSLAMEDHVFNPFMGIVTLNFGILIGTPDKPPACPTAGTYPFGGFEPEVKVFLQNKAFGSKIEGAAGEVIVETWAADTGGVFAGSFQGTLVQDTTKEDRLRAAVAGEYHFVLPEKAGGQ